MIQLKLRHSELESLPSTSTEMKKFSLEEYQFPHRCEGRHSRIVSQASN